MVFYPTIYLNSFTVAYIEMAGCPSSPIYIVEPNEILNINLILTENCVYGAIFTAVHDESNIKAVHKIKLYINFI